MRRRLSFYAAVWRPASMAAFALLLAAGPASSQSAQEFAIKASFIAKFVAFVKWPPQADRGAFKAEPFVVSVFGSNPFREDLELALRKAAPAGQAIQVRTVKDVKELGDSRVIYIGGGEEDHVPEVVAWAKSNGALTVGDGEGFAREGILINFYLDGSKVRFEINPAAAERAGFQISSLLLKVARIVEEP